MSIDPYSPPKSEPALESTPTETNHLTILFGFRGRIPRRTFWIYVIAALIPLYGLMIIVDQLIFPLTFHGTSTSAPTTRHPIGTLFLLVLSLPTIWISLALQVKRWHDHGKSAWWLLIGLIPIVGTVWVIGELGCVRGNPFPNAYGDDPLGPRALRKRNT